MSSRFRAAARTLRGAAASFDVVHCTAQAARSPAHPRAASRHAIPAAIARKDAVIRYLRAPVIGFGVLFPFFFDLAFAAGRDVPAGVTMPGMAAPATGAPSRGMMPPDSVRLPLIFVSGAVVPPLSCSAGLIRVGLGGRPCFPPGAGIAALLAFGAGVPVLARSLHAAARAKSR